VGGGVEDARGAEVEAEVIGAACCMGEMDEAMERVGGLPEGVIGPSASATRASGLPGGRV
jgi:hypothetical protein